jgi:hypothetical protein
LDISVSSVNNIGRVIRQIIHVPTTTDVTSYVDFSGVDQAQWLLYEAQVGRACAKDPGETWNGQAAEGAAALGPIVEYETWGSNLIKPYHHDQESMRLNACKQPLACLQLL